MGTLRRLFAKLLRWDKHEQDCSRISDDAPILGGRAVSADDVAAERARLRKRHVEGKRPLRDYLLLAVVAALLIYGAVDDATTAMDEGRVGRLVLLVVGVAVALVALVAVVMFKRAPSEQDAAAWRNLCAELGAEGGQCRYKAVLDWLDRYWAWPHPPRLFEGSVADLQGQRRGRPFLVLSEDEAPSDYDLRPSMNRTCVFISGPGGGPRRLGKHPLPSRPALSANVVVTPAGLFAFWVGASLSSASSSTMWAPLLDDLLDLADRENVWTVGAASPPQAG